MSLIGICFKKRLKQVAAFECYQMFNFIFRPYRIDFHTVLKMNLFMPYRTDFHTVKKTYPAGNYMFKVNTRTIETLKQGVKYVQS